MDRNHPWIDCLTRVFSAACCLLTSSPAFAADPSKDLIGAFTATYRQAPPLIRTIKQPIIEEGHPDHVVEVLTQTALLTPARLLKLHGGHYALLVSERVQDAGHAGPGALSIAYLDYRNAWTLKQVWPELVFMGERGIPADKTWEADFWSEPLILASTTWCGMDACEASIAAFVLGRTAPRLLGFVPGSAEYGVGEPGSDNCETYHYTARIDAPSSRKNVLSVIFSGWTAPPGGTKPKHWFRRGTDYAISADTLIASPDIKIPDCGK